MKPALRIFGRFFYSRKMKPKYIVLFIIMLLGLYPIVELTRVIAISGNYYFPGMHGWFVAEIAGMWLLYLAIIPVFLFLTPHIYSNIGTKVPNANSRRPMSQIRQTLLRRAPK